MRLQAATALSLAFMVIVVFVVVSAETPGRSAEPSLIYTSTPRYDAMAWVQSGERFPQGAKLMVRSGGVAHTLIADFFASADPSVSFDGKRVLFSGKKLASDHWQIWELATNHKLTQLTSCTDDCVTPFYLPEDRIVYAHKVDGAFRLEASPVNRGGPLRLTYTPGSALPTDVLRDGRILFEAAYPLGEGVTAEIYTVYPDGSGVESYRCDHGPGRHSGKQARSGDVVFAGDHGMARFNSAFAHELKVDAPPGLYTGDAIQTASGSWIMPRRRDSQMNYELVEWNPAARSIKSIAENGHDLVQPQLLVPRETPHRFPSALHNWEGANVLCLNAYTSKVPIAHGTVSYVNVYALDEKQRKLLGRAPVEADGSFFLHVPSDQPLQLELLDSSGNTIQREHGWFWMRRGEQRVCVGCHAGPERAPENAVPEVLVKSTDPADLTQHPAMAKGGR